MIASIIRWSARNVVLVSIATLFLILVGIFSGALAVIPKSGRWMVWTKKAAGLVMIVVAQYYFVKAGYNF